MSITDREPAASLPDPGERKRLRELYEVSQDELAAELKVTRKTVYAWETGKSQPAGNNRKRYAEILAAWQRKEKAGRMTA